ncbi:hypothetical protein BDW75DRAFT_123358 [Aspergillus navahoensis]
MGKFVGAYCPPVPPAPRGQPPSVIIFHLAEPSGTPEWNKHLGFHKIPPSTGALASLHTPPQRPQILVHHQLLVRAGPRARHCRRAEQQHRRGDLARRPQADLVSLGVIPQDTRYSRERRDAEIKAVVDDVEASIGPVDILVNNEGDDKILAQFDVNVFSLIQLLRAVLPLSIILALSAGRMVRPLRILLCFESCNCIYTDSVRREVAQLVRHALIWSCMGPD